MMKQNIERIRQIKTIQNSLYLIRSITVGLIVVVYGVVSINLPFGVVYVVVIIIAK